MQKQLTPLLAFLIFHLLILITAAECRVQQGIYKYEDPITVLGTSLPNPFGDENPALRAKIYGGALAYNESSKEVFIADSDLSVVRRIDAQGIIHQFVGGYKSGFSGDGGLAGEALISTPTCLVFFNNSLYICDYLNHVIRKVDSDGTISTVIGKSGTCSTTANDYLICKPSGLAFSQDGLTMYIADNGCRVKQFNIANRTASIIAGQLSLTGTVSNVDGAKAKFYLKSSSPLMYDSVIGGLYLADRSRLQFINLTNNFVSQVKDNSPSIITSLLSDSNYIYTIYGTSIKKLERNTNITKNEETIIGPGISGYTGTNSSMVPLVDINSAVMVEDQIYFVDSGKVKLFNLNSSTIEIIGGCCTNQFTISNVYGNRTSGSGQNMILDANEDIYFPDPASSVFRKIDKSTGIVSELAGTFEVSSYNVTGGVLASQMVFQHPSAIMVNDTSIYLGDMTKLFLLDTKTNLVTQYSSKTYSNISNIFYDSYSDSILVYDSPTLDRVFNNGTSVTIYQAPSLSSIIHFVKETNSLFVASSAKLQKINLNNMTSFTYGGRFENYISEINLNAVILPSVTCIYATSRDVVYFCSPLGILRLDNDLKISTITNMTGFLFLQVNDNDDLYTLSSNNVATKAQTQIQLFKRSNECLQGFYGPDCNITLCNGKFSNDSKSCSGFGYCSSKGVCNCDLLYYGKDCQRKYINCEIGDVNLIDTSFCNGRGLCRQGRNCLCLSNNFTGSSKSIITLPSAQLNGTILTSEDKNCSLIQETNRFIYKCGNTITWTTTYNGGSPSLYFSGYSFRFGATYYAPFTQFIKGYFTSLKYLLAGNDGSLRVIDGVGTLMYFSNTSIPGKVDTIYGGSDCSNSDCYGYNREEPFVCSGHGTCLGYNNCSCFNGYYGDDCSIYHCFNISSTNSSVCSGNGQCSEFDTCECNYPYVGHDCSEITCNGKFSQDANVCSGNGVCSSWNNCTCNVGYTGNDCEQSVSGHETIQCFGIAANTSFTCSGNGDCIKEDQCQCKEGFIGKNCNETSCKDGYFGAQCEYTTCSGIRSDEKMVCYGNGQCIDYNTCNCSIGYGPSNVCQYPICDGYLANDTRLCNNSHGVCVRPNECQPLDPTCFGIAQNNSKVCSGNGYCIDWDYCECTSGNIGNECEKVLNISGTNSSTNFNNSGNPNNGTLQHTDIGNGTYCDTYSNCSNSSNNSSINTNNSTMQHTDTVNSTFCEKYSNCSNTSNNSKNNGTLQHNDSVNSTLLDYSNSTNTSNYSNNSTNSSNSSNFNNSSTVRNSTNNITEIVNSTYSDNYSKDSNTSYSNNNTSTNNSSSNTNNSTMQHTDTVNSTYCDNYSNCSNTSNNSTSNGTLQHNDIVNSTYCDNYSNCSGHGECNNTGQCTCYSDRMNGFWKGQACNQCQLGYYGNQCLTQFIGPATLFNNFMGIRFNLNGPSINHQQGKVDCSKLIEKSQLNLFGANPICQWVNQSSSEFTILFSSDYSYSISPGTFVLMNRFVFDNTSQTDYEEIEVILGDNPIRPVVILNGKKSIGYCEVLSLDASKSYSVDRKPLKYLWTIISSPTINSITNFFVSNSTSILEIESERLKDSGEYKIGLQVQSTLSSIKSELNVWTFTKAAIPLPILSIIGDKEYHIQKSELPIVIKKTVDIPSCFYSNADMNIEWKQISGPNSRYENDSSHNIAIISVDGTSDSIYEYQVSSTSVVNPLSTSSDIVKITVSSSPLTLQLYLDSLSSETASISMEFNDPDQTLENEQWNWDCIMSQNKTCGSIIASYLQTSANQKLTSIEINSKDLPTSSTELVLTLTITKGIRSVSRSISITFTKNNISPPIISLISVTPKASVIPSDQIINLQLQVTTTSSDSNTETNYITREWTLNSQPLSTFNSLLSLMIIDPSLTNSIVITTSELKSGVEYQLSLKVTDNRNSLNSIYTHTFSIASPPTPCPCTITPTTGTAFQTSFTFNCQTCLSSQGSIIQTVYGFIDDKSGANIPLSSQGGIFSTKLPTSSLSSNIMSVYIKFTDPLTNAYTYTKADIQINLPVVKSVVDIKKLVSSWTAVQNSLKDGDPAKMVYNSATISRATNAMLAQLNSKRVLQTCKHGILNEEKQICECQTGFTKSDCSLTIEELEVYQEIRSSLIDGLIQSYESRNPYETLSDSFLTVNILAMESLTSKYDELNSALFDKSMKLFKQLITNTKLSKLPFGVDILIRNTINNMYLYLTYSESDTFIIYDLSKSFSLLQTSGMFVGQKDDHIVTNFGELSSNKMFRMDFSLRNISLPSNSIKLPSNMPISINQKSDRKSISFSFISSIDLFGIGKSLGKSDVVNSLEKVNGTQQISSSIISTKYIRSDILNFELLDSKILEITKEIEYNIKYSNLENYALNTLVSSSVNDSIITNIYKSSEISCISFNMTNMKENLCNLTQLSFGIATCKCKSNTNIMIIENIIQKIEISSQVSIEKSHKGDQNSLAIILGTILGFTFCLLITLITIISIKMLYTKIMKEKINKTPNNDVEMNEPPTISV